MQLLNVSTLPIYLPYDTAPVPFGDPISGITISSASPAVVNATGYAAPKNNDAVQFSVTTAGNALPSGVSAGVTYYVVGTTVSGNSFSISTIKNGAAAMVATPVNAGTGTQTIHLISNQVDGVTLPFKPNNTVLAENNGAVQATLYGANDVNVTTYGNPQGPGTWNVIGTISSQSQSLLQLGYDWIKVSASGTLALIQN